MLQLNRFDENIAINSELREVMRERNRCKRHFNKSRKPEDWGKYRILRNRAVSMRSDQIRSQIKRSFGTQ